MISKRVEKMISTQINREIESAYIYMAMQQYIANNYSFEGFEHFFGEQAKEEMDHAYSMIKFLHELDKEVSLEAIPKPQTDFKDYIDVFEKAYAHEQKVTAWIKEILVAAVEEKDFAAESLLRHFIDEQVEEEDTFRTHVETLNFIKDDKMAVMSYNLHLAKR